LTNVGKLLEQAFFAICPRYPAAFLEAGISDDRRTKTHLINLMQSRRVVNKRTGEKELNDANKERNLMSQ